MKTKELRLLLEHFSKLGDDDRKLIVLVGQEEVEIDAIIVTVGNSDDKITRIAVKNESLRLDLPEYPTGPLSYIERGILHPSASPERSHTTLPQGQTSLSDGQPALRDVHVSVATLEHLKLWRQNYEKSLTCGDGDSSISSTNVIGMARRERAQN